MTFIKHPASVCSHKGLLYIDRANKKIERTMTRENAKFVQSKIFKDGVSSGFWPSARLKKANDFMEKMDTLSMWEVDYVEHPIMWSEMTNEQILDAYLFLCDVLEYLNGFGYTMSSHLWNVVLSQGKFKLIDVGDFYPYDRDMQAHTLKLCLEKKEHEVESYVPGQWLNNPEAVIRAIETHTHINQVREALQKSGTKQNDEHTTWDRYVPEFLKFEDVLTSAKNEKDAPVYEWVKECKPETLTDLGCNTGKHSLLASKLGIKVVGLDYAANTVDEATRNATRMGLSCSFAHVNLLSPIRVGSYDPAEKRLWSEMVIAPALVHHLFMACNDINLAVDTIVKYSSKYVAIETIPHTDKHINKDIKNWFDEGDIVKRLEEHGYSSIHVRPSFPTGRKWIFAESPVTRDLFNKS